MKNNSKTKRTENNSQSQLGIHNTILGCVLVFFMFFGSVLMGAASVASQVVPNNSFYCYSDGTGNFSGNQNIGVVVIQGESVNIRYQNTGSVLQDKGSYININPNINPGNRIFNNRFIMSFPKPIKDLKLKLHDVESLFEFNIVPDSYTNDLTLTTRNEIRKNGGVNLGGEVAWNNISGGSGASQISFMVFEGGSMHLDLLQISFNYADGSCSAAPLPVVINASITGQDISCGSDGSLSVSLLGGLNPNNFTFALKKDSGSYQEIS